MKPAILAIAALMASPAAFAQRPAVDVRIIEGDLPTPYTVVGQVSAEAHQTSLFPKKSARDMVQDQLREKAARLGADAVILVTYDGYNPITSKKGYRAAGQAVKFSTTTAAAAPAPPPPVTVAAPAPAPVAAPPAAVPAPTTPAVAPSAAPGILLTEQNVARAYDVLGPVSVELNQGSLSLDKTGRQVLDEALQKEAARLGADAIIMIRYAAEAGAKAPTAIGVAVKYK